MIIQTLEKKYTVIKYVFSDSNTERYICREERGKKKYTVVCVKNKMWIQKAMQFFVQQKENRHFTDFVTCFFSEECFYVVMNYAEGGMPLKAKLEKERCFLKERMVIGKNILEKLLLFAMPDYFLSDCLKPETILLSPSLEVSFRYELSKIKDYDKADFLQVQNHLLALFTEIFKKELEKGMLPPMEAFCNSLKEEEYQDILEVYTIYGKMCEEIKDIPEKELALPQTRSFRIWERIRRCFGPFKKICALLLMLSAIIFLMYSVQVSMETGGEKKVFDSIGTLKIK